MLVSTENYEAVLQEILQENFIAVDTETTGLRAYHGDQIFSLIITTEKSDFYFNFNEYPGVEPLPSSCIEGLARVFSSPQIHKVFHNAKFDLGMLKNSGLDVKGPIFDLWTLDRLHDNQHYSYELDKVAKRWGREKDDAVTDYIKKHKLSKWVEIPHLNKKYQEKYYSQVPLEIMRPYAENDARITYDISKLILGIIEERDQTAPANWPKLMQVVQNESRLTETLFRMEQRGVKIDSQYCEEARIFYENLAITSTQEFKKLTGLDFVKGETVFAEVFKDESLKYTEKGNPIFDKKAMKGFKHPAAQCVIEYSEAKKQLEYFQNFLWFADKDGVIHGDFVQAGTTTGRFSSRDPNLQNLTNPDKYGDEEERDSAKYPVRRAFIPRPGFFFAMLDYSQIEYRVMLDVAKANALINEILAGLDVHGATSKLANVTRKHAKTVNFLTLYGGGVAKLANDLFETRGSLKQLQVMWMNHLGMKLREEKDQEILKTITPEFIEYNLPLLLKAKEIQDAIFKASPEIKDFIKGVSKAAKDRGYIRNWFGRRYYFSNKNFTYKAPNHYIQGSCADILKVAMNRIDDLLMDYESKMILTIHDELVFEIKFGEEHLIEKIKAIMESVYPYKRLPLLVEAEFSFDNLADKQDWSMSEFIRGKETRDTLEGTGHSRSQSAPAL
jgi:DNA polymerase-1